jgi:hypothetical protein
VLPCHAWPPGRPAGLAAPVHSLLVVQLHQAAMMACVPGSLSSGGPWLIISSAGWATRPPRAPPPRRLDGRTMMHACMHAWPGWLVEQGAGAAEAARSLGARGAGTKGAREQCISYLEEQRL